MDTLRRTTSLGQILLNFLNDIFNVKLPLITDTFLKYLNVLETFFLFPGMSQDVAKKGELLIKKNSFYTPLFFQFSTVFFYITWLDHCELRTMSH